MRYFIVTAFDDATRSQRVVIAGPFGAVAPMLDALDSWLDQRNLSAGGGYRWWIDQDGSDQQLVIEQKPTDHVM